MLWETSFQREGLCIQRPSSHPDWMMEDLIHFHQDLTIFHFSGHANGTQLQLEDPTDDQAFLHKERLRDLLKNAPKLQLVVLNACATSGQVQALKDIGIPAVIATNFPVEDEKASMFGTRLYQGIGKGIALADAFDKALAAADPSNKKLINIRGFELEDPESNSPLNPWALFDSGSQIQDWRLPTPQGRVIDLSSQVPRALKRTEFVGREEDLRKLMHMLQRESSVLLLNGLGGIGKTTLAKEYVYQHQNEYRHIAWVNILQDQNSPDTFSQSAYTALANHIGLFSQLEIPFDREMPEKDRFRTIVAEMNRREGPNLLVLDNVGSSILTYYEDLPKAPGWKILATSRQELTPFSTYYLDELPMEEAERLFTNLYPDGKKYAPDVQDLLNHIGRHTLTIELLARLCAEYPSIHPAGILKRLQDKQFQQLSQSVWSHHSKREIEVYGYLMAAFSLTSLSEEELHQLIQWAVLPSVFTDWETILQLFKVDSLEVNSFENALRGLRKKGWVTREKETGKYRCHQLIQEVIRYKFPPEKQNCFNVIQGARNLLSIDQGKDNPIEKFPLIIYGEAILSHIEGEGKEINTLKNNLATVYQDLGRYEQSAQLLEATLVSDLKNFGEQHPNVAISSSSLAISYQSLGRYEEAAQLLEAALASDRKNFGEQHPNVAKRNANLATVYQDLGRFEQAAHLLEMALESELKNFGEEHPNVARCRSNLAQVYQDLGRFEQAAKLAEVALESAQKIFGEEHPIVAIRGSNLALVYRDLGRYEEAAQLLEEAVELTRKNFGEEHPKMGISRSNLATVYRSLGQYERAAPLLEAALESAQKNFGEDHPNLAISRSNLAIIYQDLGRYEEAAKLLEAALELDLKNFGEEHPNVAISCCNLATAYKDLGRLKEAKELYEAAYSIFIESLGTSHPHTQTVKKYLDSFEEGANFHS